MCWAIFTIGIRELEILIDISVTVLNVSVWLNDGVTVFTPTSPSYHTHIQIHRLFFSFFCAISLTPSSLPHHSFFGDTLSTIYMIPLLDDTGFGWMIFSVIVCLSLKFVESYDKLKLVYYDKLSPQTRYHFSSIKLGFRNTKELINCLIQFRAYHLTDSKEIVELMTKWILFLEISLTIRLVICQSSSAS